MNYSVLFKNEKWFYPLLLLQFFIMTSCSKEKENNPEIGNMTFKLESEDLDCSKDGNYLVPFSGKTYTISVNASENVKWNVDVTSKDLMTVNIEGEQSGNGTIELTATPNPEKIAGRTATVIINSTVKDTKRTFIFEQKEKELLIPEGTEGQSTADFQNPSSKYNIHYMKEGDHVAIFWDKSLGLRPTRFDEDRAIEEADKAFIFLQNDMGFANKTNSYANKYKFLIFINKEDQWGAYGGGDNYVGKVWLGPNHLEESERNNAYCIFYHEMCHCFQAMAQWDGAAAMGGPINELTSQYAILCRYSNWMEIDPSRVQRYLNLTHLGIDHEGLGYRGPWILEYWDWKHGPKFVSRIWTEAIDNDNSDFIACYQRLTEQNQEQFCDELFDAQRRFITWDIPRIKEGSKGYASKHTCKLKKETNNQYIISPSFCPQNYGYNGIKLNLPESNNKIEILLTGYLNNNNYKIKNKDEAGWHFGLVSVTNSNECIYSDVIKVVNNNNGKLSYEVPENTKELWLVVSATPTKHRKHIIDQELGENNDQRIYQQWPYKITLFGTTVNEKFIE